MNATAKGAFLGLLTAAALLLVPVLGVRKDPSALVLNWQELALYCASCLGASITGARLAFLELRNKTNMKQDCLIDKQITQSDTRSGAAPEVAFKGDDDQLELLREPLIEKSLAGGPKKRKSFWKHAIRTRTRVLIACLYIILYVNCAVLCQKFDLGNLRLSSLESEIVRSTGLVLCLLGIYLAVRAHFKRTRATAYDGSVARTGILAEPGTEAEADLPASEFKRHDATIHSPSRQDSHVPPTRLSFLADHPVCAGWMSIFAGLPLIFLAWFPLIAIPGILVGMNWLFSRRKTA